MIRGSGRCGYRPGQPVDRPVAPRRRAYTGLRSGSTVSTIRRPRFIALFMSTCTAASASGGPRRRAISVRSVGHRPRALSMLARRVGVAVGSRFDAPLPHTRGKRGVSIPRRRSLRRPIHAAPGSCHPSRTHHSGTYVPPLRARSRLVRRRVRHRAAERTHIHYGLIPLLLVQFPARDH